MNSVIIQSSVILIGIISIPLCETRWKFLDSNGHKIRHNRYWKLQYSNGDKPEGCSPRRNAINYSQCPLELCRIDEDCSTTSRGRGRCVCDKVLCGRVCVEDDAGCEYPYGFTNGVASIEPNNRIGSVVTYRCYEGYRLEGFSKRTCQANKVWSGEAPRCVPETFCSSPPIVPFAVGDASKNDKFPAGATVTYRCLEGYAANGLNFEAICGADGQWIKPQIRCIATSCGHPGDIPHANFIGNNFSYQAKVVYLCKDGFEFVCTDGKACQVRECQANGQWSGTKPICKRIHCPRLKAPANGFVSGSQTLVGSHVVFSCKPGYYLVGSRERRCTDDGKWNGANATCKILNCGLPPYVPQAHINYTDTRFGSTAYYRCFSIYETLFNEEFRTLRCGSNGKWTPAAPNCLKLCNSMKTPNQSMPHAREEVISCPAGHLQRRPASPDCVNGSWSSSPLCQPAPCLNKLPMGANSQAFYYSLEHGSVARFNCTFGYVKTSGNDILRCHYGTWSGIPPVCKRKCSRPPIPLNGKIYLVGMYGRWLYMEKLVLVLHDDVVEYECREGYVLKGTKRAVCKDGEWVPSTTPKCEKIKKNLAPSTNVPYK